MLARPRRKKPSYPDDPATAYAIAVDRHEIVAGPYVRAACKRHLADLRRLIPLGYTWNEIDPNLEPKLPAVDRVIEFFKRALTVEIEESDGVSKSIEFILQPWQCFIVGSLFGWKNPQGLRRFRRAYVEEAKGNGKALALDTPIPTPDGWTTMGQLGVGDKVFDELGQPCSITYTTNEMYGHGCFEVMFDDGSKIIADEDHLWPVEKIAEREFRCVTTESIAIAGLDNLIGKNRIAKCQAISSVPVKCIAVDSPSHLYLAGEGMVPTHNTPLAAGIGFYMMMATKKLRAEVYSAATDRDQAAILFRDAIAMWERSPDLKNYLVPFGDKAIWQLSDRATDSFFKPISSEKRGKSGIRPYCALVDEIHEHPDDSVIEMLRAGTKMNQQALIFEITNAGFDRESVCWKEHEYTVKVVNGDTENEAWFGFIASLDDDDDPFEDESCWIKANPNLGVSIQYPYIREQVTEAKGMPSKEALVRRLHFCTWTDASKTWIPRVVWEKIEAPFVIEDYAGQPCALGLDMSFTQDLTALAYVFPTGEDTFDAFIDYWKPKEKLVDHAKLDGVNYPLWAKQGLLFATEGPVIKLEHVAQRIGWAMDMFDITALAYDRYRHRELDQELTDLGIEPPLIEHPQGFRRGPSLDLDSPVLNSEDDKKPENPLWMPGSFEKLETAIIEGRLRIAINPVTRWNVSCVAIRDDPAGTGNRVFDKKKCYGRIDGMVALAMALGAASLPKSKPRKSVYELMAEQGPRPAVQSDDEKIIDYMNKPDAPIYAEARRRWERAEDLDDD